VTPDSTSKPNSSIPESEGSRSTARPPVEEKTSVLTPDSSGELDLAAAVRAVRTATPARLVAPAATAKIRPFQLAEALARLSADPDPSSIPPTPGREGVKEAETSGLAYRSTMPTLPIDILPEDLAAIARNFAPLREPTPPTSVAAIVAHESDAAEPARPNAATPTGKDGGVETSTQEEPITTEAMPSTNEASTSPSIRARRPLSPIVLILAVVGLAMLVYAYLTANR
jgi:hypothetical protein